MSVKSSISGKLKQVKTKDEKDALTVLLAACTHNTDGINNNKLREMLGFSKQSLYNNLNSPQPNERYTHKKSKERMKVCEYYCNSKVLMIFVITMKVRMLILTLDELLI